ncbi:hypothetical protein BDZ85DRAFT_117749 [Elsinoe ampelina]|uniref:Uncharacterized protein n=1 Tax=Elsinoe ampelina TaxID=302913 RepID=A0A6A6GBQ2_9PEZI|nr:hypothetical protein BDZ85DRAFT_117749 [Elsinoe ampelina]
MSPRFLPRGRSTTSHYRHPCSFYFYPIKHLYAHPTSTLTRHCQYHPHCKDHLQAKAGFSSTSPALYSSHPSKRPRSLGLDSTPALTSSNPPRPNRACEHVDPLPKGIDTRSR